MKELMLKNNWSKEELEKLDCYFDDDKAEELLSYDNKTIINFIESCEKTLGYCLCVISLEYYISGITGDARYDVDETKLEYYEKLMELINHFDFLDFGLMYAIGDYFHEKGDYEKALYYYQRVFKNGFNLCNENYFNSLVRYLKLLKINPSEILKDLIKHSKKDGKYSVSFIDTYLLLIINLKKFSDEYFHYILEGIKIATPVVRKLQENTKNRNYFSDSVEERDLCELVALKLEYYVEHKQYVKAFDAYKELTDEILRSDCTRYYHARDKYYRQLLSYMTDDYPELAFFENIGYETFKVLEDYDTLIAGQRITLEKDNGLRFKFKINHVYDEKDVILVPLLPLLGEGGLMYMDIKKSNGQLYLINRFSN